VERNQLIAIVVIVVVIAGAGVAFIFLNQPTRPPEDTLIWETIGNPQYLDPHVDYETFGSWICYNVYETLYTYSWNSADTTPSIPLLAASQPVVSADGLNYTITLRTGITFSDGTPFNASCVKWNFERAMKIFYLDGPVWMLAEPIKGGAAVEAAAYDTGPTSPEFIAAFDDWVANSNSIIVLDENTIRFVLEDPYPPFISAYTYEVGAIMSPSFAIAHATNATDATWANYGVAYGEYDNYMHTHMCGTGPYTLANWVPDQYIQLDIKSDYWRTSTSANAGSIKHVYIKTNEDVNGRILNLRAGTTDVTYWPTTNAKEVYNTTLGNATLGYSTDPNIFLQTGLPTYNVMFLGYNMATFNTTEGLITTSPYANKNFRLCSSYAFDYNAMIDTVLSGFGVQLRGPIPQGMLGYNATSFTINYNFTKAVEYWNLAMQDPVFIESMNNITDTMTIYYNSGNTGRQQGSLILADGLTAVVSDPSANLTGLDHTPQFVTQALEWANYLDHIRLRQMPIFFIGWAPDYADPDDYVFPFCYSGGTFAYRVGLDNGTIDSLYALAKATDVTALREQYYSQIDEILADIVPYLWAYQETTFRAWRTWLHGDALIYNPMTTAGPYFYHLYKVY